LLLPPPPPPPPLLLLLLRLLRRLLLLLLLLPLLLLQFLHYLRTEAKHVQQRRPVDGNVQGNLLPNVCLQVAPTKRRIRHIPSSQSSARQRLRTPRHLNHDC
jgi:hypothetical protein